MIINFLVFVLLTIGCSRQENQQNNLTQNFKLATISLPSIMCNMCVTTISNAVKKLDGVENIKIKLSEKVALIKFDASKTDLNTLETAISEAGYDANETSRNREAYENLPACCKDGK